MLVSISGRNMIIKAKDFLESSYGARIVYGDTDSIFCIFPRPAVGIKGHAAIVSSIALAHKASGEFKKLIKRPHDLEYDKTFWPFILLSKKRYVGNLYEDSPDSFVQKSMGIVLKRRDNAPIVKKIYGGIIDIILNQHDVKESVRFLKQELEHLTLGECPLEDLIVSKSLRSGYSDPTRIAHKVLAERMGVRDPGTKPMNGDRIPYVYCALESIRCKKSVLQGERIEHPDYIREKNLSPDYHFYVTNQIMKPVLQIYALVVEKLEGYGRPKGHFDDVYKKLIKESALGGDEKKIIEKVSALRETCAMEILFAPALGKLACKNSGNVDIASFFPSIKVPMYPRRR